jgi:hypothetical protein
VYAGCLSAKGREQIIQRAPEATAHGKAHYLSGLSLVSSLFCHTWPASLSDPPDATARSPSPDSCSPRAPHLSFPLRRHSGPPLPGRDPGLRGGGGGPQGARRMSWRAICPRQQRRWVPSALPTSLWTLRFIPVVPSHPLPPSLPLSLPPSLPPSLRHRRRRSGGLDADGALPQDHGSELFRHDRRQQGLSSPPEKTGKQGMRRGKTSHLPSLRPQIDAVLSSPRSRGAHTDVPLPHSLPPSLPPPSLASPHRPRHVFRRLGARSALHGRLLRFQARGRGLRVRQGGRAGGRAGGREGGNKTGRKSSTGWTCVARDAVGIEADGQFPFPPPFPPPFPLPQARPPQ